MPKKQRQGLKDSGELKYNGEVDKQGGVTGHSCVPNFSLLNKGVLVHLPILEQILS